MKIYHAPHIDLLFEQLRQSLVAENLPKDIFVPEVIIIPNHNIAAYLKLKLAQSLGIAINVEFPFPEVALQNLYLNLRHYVHTGEKPERGFFLPPGTAVPALKFASQQDWQSVILRRLLTDCPAYFSNYLGDVQRVRERKAWALSKRLAAYFREYRYHRPDFFRQNELPQTGDRMAEAQLDLLAQVQNDFKKLQLTDFFSVADELVNLAREIPEKQTLRLFATAQFSWFHTELLLRLSDYIPIEIYQVRLNPETVSNDSLATVLQKWNIASEKGVQLVSQIKNKLNLQVQEIALQEKNKKTEKINKREIKFFAASTIRREMEQVARAILEELQQDPSLGLSDIAVLIPDVNRYWPCIQAVFHQSEIPLAFNLSDASAAATSSYAKAALILLELTTGQFTRENLFKLFYNPCFLAKFSLNRRIVQFWFRWTEELDVYAGSSYDDFYLHPDGSRDWLTALKRLRLGLVMEPQPQQETDFPMPHVPGWLENRESLYLFCQVTEELRKKHQERDFLRKCGAELLEEFCTLLESYLAVPENRPAEAAAKRSLQYACQREAERQRALGNNGGYFTSVLLKNLIRDTAQEIPLRLGRYLGGGVTVSSLLPMRPVPFRIIFIVGLDDASFPRESRRDRLDLRFGFFSAANGFDTTSDLQSYETDLQIFAEILVACKERIYLSYRNLDVKKDIRLLAAQPYRELQKLYAGAVQSHLVQEPAANPEINMSSAAKADLRVAADITKTQNNNSAEIRVKDRDISRFLKFPLEYWLRQNHLYGGTDEEEFDKRLRTFEQESFPIYVKKNLLLSSLHRCFELGFFPQRSNFSEEFKKILADELKIKKKIFQAPYGIFLESEKEQIAQQAEILALGLQKLSIQNWQQFRRIAHGELGLDEYFVNRNQPWKIITENNNFLLSCLSPIYHWESREKQVELIIFEPDGFVTHIKNPEKIHIKLNKHLSLLKFWLPLLPELANEAKPVTLHLIIIPIDKKTGKKNSSEEEKDYTPAVQVVDFFPDKAFRYLQSMLQEMQSPDIPDMFHADALKDMSNPNLTTENIQKYRGELLEIWQSRDSDYGASTKYYNPLVDILPLWLNPGMQDVILRRYVPFYDIVIPRVAESGKRSKTTKVKKEK